MRILAIETSCDDTGVAIMEWPSFAKASEGKLLSNIVSSQVKIHAPYGGVVPNLAQRAHQKNLVPVLEMAMREAAGLQLRVESRSTRLASTRLAGEAGELRESRRENYELRERTEKIKEILQREPVLLEKTLEFLRKYSNPSSPRIPPTLKLWRTSRRTRPDVDLIAVTYGPGLAPCLWTGVNFAKALACAWDLPIVPVNHIEAHIFANFIGENMQLLTKNYKLPTLCLVVSGGHTQLILMKNIGNYEIIGETRDDAAGEAFDKVAKLLGLGYPGGPAISREAEKWNQQLSRNNNQTEVKFPRPMINAKDFDFSFSGLKTAVLYELKKSGFVIPAPQNAGQAPAGIQEKQSGFPIESGMAENEREQYIRQICFEFQQAVVDVLVKKTIRAAEKYDAKIMMLSGGVAANELLRSSLKNEAKKIGLNFVAPQKSFCSDNAAMVALAGYWHRDETQDREEIEAEANLRLN